MKRIILTLCVFIALSTVDNATGAYRCVGRDGNSMITDNPPPGAKCKEMGESNEPTSVNRAQPPLTWSQMMDQHSQHLQDMIKKTYGVDLTQFPSMEQAVKDARASANSEFASKYGQYGDRDVYPDWTKAAHDEIVSVYMQQAEARYKDEVLKFNHAAGIYKKGMAAYAEQLRRQGVR